MKGKKITVIVLLIVVSVFAIKILPFFLPLRFAVSENELNKSDNYIICERGDGYIGNEWRVLSGNDEVSGTYMLVEGTSAPGNIYNAYGFEDTHRFVFYGEIDKATENNDIKTFNAEKWDVLYPVKHQDFLGALISKKYLCLYDTAYTFEEYMKLFNEVFIWNYKSLVPDEEIK